MENKWFKKTMLLLTAACLTFSVTGCKGEKVMDTVLEKTDTKKEAEEEKEEKPEVPVKKPELSMNLSGSVTYNVGTAAGALQVEAVASDGAEITYQWYKSFTNTNGGGTVIKNATKNTFTPPTKEAGTTYYYAVATSTIGNSTNRVTSDTIEVIVSENPEQPENAEGGEKPAQEP